MSGDDLRSALGRAVGAPDARPEVDELWARGRGRRRRTRVLATAAAVVVVSALAVGAVALAAGDDGEQDVMAGSGRAGAEVPAPPPEPPGTVILVLVTTAREDGVPVVEPNGSFTVDLDGPAGASRSAFFRWEAWDGVAWSFEHTLLPGGADGPAEVLGPEVGPSMSVTWPVGRGVGPLMAPDADPGWYRVCAEVHGDPAMPQEPASDPAEMLPCAQLRVVEHVAEPDDEPPAAVSVDPPPAEEPVGEITVAAVEPGPVETGAVVPLEVRWSGGTLGGNTTWEQWDGVGWVPTHLVTSFTTTRGEPELTSLTGDASVDVPDVDYSTDASQTPIQVRVPPAADLVSPWSRVCVDVGGDDAARPCVPLDVDGEPAEVDPDFVQEPSTFDGDDATWEIDPADPPTPEATTVAVLVTRVDCNGGMTGETLIPQVEVQPDRIVITIDVAPVRGDRTCPGNDAVPVTVDLGEPIGTRPLDDGSCRDSNRMVECEPLVQRWPLG